MSSGQTEMRRDLPGGERRSNSVLKSGKNLHFRLQSNGFEVDGHKL